MAIQLFLENVRLSYPSLGVPDYYQGKKQKENDKKRWSASFIVGPESTARWDNVKGAQGNAFKMMTEAIDKIADQLFNSDKAKAKLWKVNVLTDPKACCWTDGARKEMEGMFIMSSHRTEDKGRPLVLDKDRSPIYKADNSLYESKAGVLYAGCFVNAHIELWGQKSPAPQGFRSTLLGVQYCGEGEAFGGGMKPTADAFGDAEDGATDDDLG